jgi:hypothetical protein
VIHDAVLHLHNEQPLLVDIFETPSPTDTVLVCTNLRTMSKTRPIFADRVGSTFIFPYSHIRFVELPTRATATAPEGAALAIQLAGPVPEREPDLEFDEDFLRRVRDL